MATDKERDEVVDETGVDKTADEQMKNYSDERKP